MPKDEIFTSFILKLNQGKIIWPHNYFYHFYKTVNVWCKQIKLTSLIPSPLTSEGQIYLLQKKYHNLEKYCNSFQLKYHELEKNCTTALKKYQDEQKKYQEEQNKRLQALENV